MFTLSCQFRGWDWFGWLESRTVTAEPHNQLPHRTFNQLEWELKFLDRREVQNYKTKRTGRPRKCSGQRIFAVK